MNNKEIYQKAIDQIKASEKLKEKTIKNIQNKSNIKIKKFQYMKYLSACAVFVLIFSIGIFYFNDKEINDNINNSYTKNEIAKINNDLPRFKNINEIKSILQKEYEKGKNLSDEIALAETIVTDTTMKSELSNSNREEKLSNDYSTTNVQVENVDEADIVKTDGAYIYYVTNNYVYIIEANTLSEVIKIDLSNEKEKFYIQEIFLKENKLIVLGNYHTYIQLENEIGSDFSNEIKSENKAKAVILDITNKKNPKEIRTVALDGIYRNSRMIENNLYFISSKTPNYYNNIKDEELLPNIKDSVNGDRIVDSTEIVYFKDTGNYAFMTVAGLNINDNSKVNTETFFGASNDIYCSENNLYIIQTSFVLNEKNTIYKFNLNDSKVTLQCKCEVNGALNNQFSIDEYEGKLRIATTNYSYDQDYTNQLYIFDENLNEISRIENLAKGEKIYAVRFVEKTAYIVTFKQIDPLFVIDLSDPKNPVVRGELKIPGYSSYLHLYDETHIIGIGYNTKSNGYGGITNSNMKMSMFDVSDLENPKEMFSINIGENKATSSITDNHKALFYSKNKNLIGFPVTFRGYNASNDKNGFVMYYIDLEEGFTKYGEILQKINYITNIQRAIYIGDNLYTLSKMQVVKYDLNTFEKKAELNLAENEN